MSVALSGGCAPRSNATRTSWDRVPELPPDFLPEWVTADSSRSADRLFTKGIVVVFFVDDATRKQRQAAINRVGGRVVGWLPIFTGNGYYYIRIADDGSGKQLRRAIDVLSALPQVEDDSLDHRLDWLPAEPEAAR